MTEELQAVLADWEFIMQVTACIAAGEHKTSHWGPHVPDHDDYHAPCPFPWGPLPETGEVIVRARCCAQNFIARGETLWEAQWRLHFKLRDHVGADFAQGRGRAR
jgi:hypothetical protein